MPKKLYLRIALAARIALWGVIAFIALFGKWIVAGRYFPCLMYEQFGVQCSTCGASRAVVSLLSGNVAAAAELNPVITFGVVPLLGFLLLSDLVVMIMNVVSKKRRLSPFEYLFAVFDGTFTREGAAK